MLLQPAILALLLASGLSAVLLTAVAPFAVTVLRRWDLTSGSARQLMLERRTCLVSTLLAFVLATQTVALLLFVFNADCMADLFVGAMCAVGALNVNPYGFPALGAQILVFFLAALWLLLNHVDNRAWDYPLIRYKYAFLLLILPCLWLVFLLELRYFSGLKADVITSCCGSLFSPEKNSLSGDLAALPPKPAMLAFYATFAVILANGLWFRRSGRGGYGFALLSALTFGVALAAMVSFISLYIYEHPHHHCPFCILKSEYGYRGYWLYPPLFIATAAGMGIGILQPFAGIASLRPVIAITCHRLATLAIMLFFLFLALTSWMMWRSHLVLLAS